jgi:hypothetical protein
MVWYTPACTICRVYCYHLYVRRCVCDHGSFRSYTDVLSLVVLYDLVYGATCTLFLFKEVFNVSIIVMQWLIGLYNSMHEYVWVYKLRWLISILYLLYHQLAPLGTRIVKIVWKKKQKEITFMHHGTEYKTSRRNSVNKLSYVLKFVACVLKLDLKLSGMVYTSYVWA